MFSCPGGECLDGFEVLQEIIFIVQFSTLYHLAILFVYMLGMIFMPLVRYPPSSTVGCMSFFGLFGLNVSHKIFLVNE